MKVSIASPFRRPKAERTHRSSVPAPQPPHAATATEPGPNPFAGLYPYLPSTLAGIRAAIERNRAEAIEHDARGRDFDTRAREEADLAAHKRETAEDFERLLVLVSADAQRNAYVAVHGAPMGEDLLLNGVQPDPRAAVADTEAVRGWGDPLPVEPRPSRDGDTETLPVVRVPAEVIR